MKRYWNKYFTTAANTSEQVFDFTTNDDVTGYALKELFVGITTAGVQVGVYINGTLKSTVDCTRFAAGDQVLTIDGQIEAKVPLRIAFTNLAGTTLTNVPVTIGIDSPRA